MRKEKRKEDKKVIGLELLSVSLYAKVDDRRVFLAGGKRAKEEQKGELMDD